MKTYTIDWQIRDGDQVIAWGITKKKAPYPSALHKQLTMALRAELPALTPNATGYFVELVEN